ncbi:hypothetical protein D1007_35596 [Hordeum vulgare]|nr:hypothetical protein D1007_35596 [Hordeum vulgare]
MRESEAVFTVAQAEEMTEQQAIPESIEDEAEVEANWELLRQKQAEADALCAELEADMEEEEETGAEQPEAPERVELQLSRMYPSKGTEIVDISGEK